MTLPITFVEPRDLPDLDRRHCHPYRSGLVGTCQSGPRGLVPGEHAGPAWHSRACLRIDLILISHNHYDHLDSRDAEASAADLLAHRSRRRRRRAAGRTTRLRGYARTRLVGRNVRSARGLKVTFVPAQHSSARGLFDRHRSLWGGYMVESRGRRHLFQRRLRILGAFLGYQIASGTLPMSRCSASAPMSCDGSAA